MLVLHADLPANPDAPEISSAMPAPDIIKCLVQCGCPDATNDLRIPGPSSEPAAIGGYSDVYHGYLRDGTSVAIKCPRAPAAQGITGGGDNPNKVLKRAAKELYTWSTLNHPNIAKLLGVAMYLGRMSMVSPWISPGNFYYYVAKHRESVNHFDLCVQVAEGLAYLHGNSVIHGDLKACNVLVSEDGEVKLTDFGLSFLEESALRFTASQNHCEGTARWMAPELIQQSSPRCVETDVYAFGMTVVEIMTEAVPFAEIDSNGRVMYSVAHEGKTPTRPPRLAFGSAKNNTWWFILAQCWSPSARYRPTIEQVLRGLTSESWDRTINTWRLWTRKMSESLSSGMIHTHRDPHVAQVYSSTTPVKHNKYSNSQLQCFGVTVGIDSLHSQGVSGTHFRDAANDADRIAEFLRHQFSCGDRITSLRNSHATPAAIVDTFERLLDNPIVQKGDYIVFYYAGPPFGDLDLAFSNRAEREDGSAKSPDNDIHGVTETLLVDVMEKLALLKGCRVWIIADFCRSGHFDSNTLLDEQWQCFSSETRLSDESGGRSLFQDSAPYVVFSAFNEEEELGLKLKSSSSSGCGGHFTDALLKTIRLGSLPTTTFMGLLNQLLVTLANNMDPAQPTNPRTSSIPACIGSMKNQIIFARGRSPAFPVQYFDAEEGMWMLKAGSHSGVTTNSVWEIFAVVTTIQSPVAIGTSIAKEPGRDATRLQPRSKHEMKKLIGTLQDSCKDVSVYAVPVEGASSHPLRVYIETKKLLMISDIPSLYSQQHSDNTEPSTHYVTQSIPEDADLIVRCQTHNPDSDLEYLPVPGSWEGLELQTEAAFYLQTPQVLAFHRGQPLLCGIAPVYDIATALRAAAWWNWHLNCINTPTLLQTKISLQLLKLGEWKGSALLRCSATPLPMTETGIIQLLVRPQDRYGIKIINNAKTPLYAWAFYFSANDLSIDKLFNPVPPSPNVPPGGSITIGDNISPQGKIGFALEHDRNMDIGFIKLFWFTEYLDMGEVAQPAPCCETYCQVSPKTVTSIEKCLHNCSEWGAITITVVQTL